MPVTKSNVVFVGNIPYNMTEAGLVKLFQSVGEVVGFRLLFDRDTGRSKGYGFCEFPDHATALSAVRNLNNTDCGGRPLRIDLADSDPLLEGKATVRGQIVQNNYSSTSKRPKRHVHWHLEDSESDGFLATIPPGVAIPDGGSALTHIDDTIAKMPQHILIEVLSQTKRFVIDYPDYARVLLDKHPQIAYALFRCVCLSNVVNVDKNIMDRIMVGAVSTGPGTIEEATSFLNSEKLPQMQPLINPSHDNASSSPEADAQPSNTVDGHRLLALYKSLNLATVTHQVTAASSPLGLGPTFKSQTEFQIPARMSSLPSFPEGERELFR